MININKVKAEEAIKILGNIIQNYLINDIDKIGGDNNE
ncbi:Uncharacterised protein [[Clostridium] sordellii]|uniref:Uncharacterized protein n=1 Tax=Paraclostridium sordellii TaxID=1505 RepID=A0A9P1PB88_PARSO|nr:Uncharacterised protein [[Clostridium] sordellii] [Paeniclostridium sordellii]